MQIALSNAVAAQRVLASSFSGASVVLDFTRGHAIWNGAFGPLAARLTCNRDAAALAPDTGGALRSFPANTLRCTSRGLLVEETRTNFVPNSFTPAPTDLALAAGTYTVSGLGTGTVSLTGAATGTATSAASVSFTLAAPGSVTLTPSAGVTFMQLENGAFATSPIATGATAATRDIDRITFSSVSWFDPQNCTLLVEWEQVAPATGAQTLVRWQNASFGRLRSGNFVVAQVNDASANLIFNAGSPGGPAPSGIHRLAAALAPNNMEVAWSGSLASGVVGSSIDTSGTPAPGATTFLVGAASTSECLNGWIRRLVFWPARLTQPHLFSVL
ncbi:hypothetical protein [Devosia sediminis]|uniref:Uncharacterized protein n=1 Tax=Devosia sediminis TaxID=2798801 RepID=A0A934IM02_9HYPH|nr:hypothetical protein [Devosia sediminis]MBJ3783128.1 hypothetical protein [Devosia sediminis]